MSRYKNKLLTGLILASTFSTASANAATYTISSNTNSQTLFDGGTNAGTTDIVVNEGITASGDSFFGDQAILVQTTINTINNYGTIISSGSTALEISGFGDVTSFTNHDTGTIGSIKISITAGSIDTFTNDGIISNILLIENNSDVGPINNSGTIGHLYLEENSTIASINNSGTINTELTVVNSSILGGVTNQETGSIASFFLNDAVLGNINNYGSSGSISAYNGGEINSINNYSGASMGSINLFGTFIDEGINNHGGTISSITLYDSPSEVDINNDNGSYILYSVTVGDGGKIGTLTNEGTIGYIAIEEDSTGTISSIINSGVIEGYGLFDDDIPVSIYYGNSDDNNLTLQPGSQINGLIMFGTGSNNMLNVESGFTTASFFTLEGNYEVNCETDVLCVENGNNLAILPTTSDSSAIAENSLRASVEIGNLLSTHLSKFRNNSQNNSNSVSLNDRNSIELASNHNNNRSDANSNLGLNFGSKTNYWTEAFGSYQERSSYKNNQSSETSVGGVLFGADKEIDSQTRIGGFVGALNGSTNIVSTRSIDSKGGYVGAYLSQNQDSYFTDFALIAGYLESDSGTPGSSTEFNNVFFTPSVTLGKKLNSLPATISGTLRYTGQWIDDSEEVVSGNVITTKSKYLNNISGRLEIRSDDKVSKIANGNFAVNVRGGLEANKTIGNREVSINVIGETASYNPNVRKYNIDGFVGTNVSYELQDNVKIYADLEGSKGITKNLSNNRLGLFGKVGVKWNF